MLSKEYPNANVHMVPRGNEFFGNPNNYDNLGMLGFWIKKHKIDILITIADLWMTDFILDMDIGKTRWIRYIPLDAYYVTHQQRESILRSDVPLAMSKFGQDAIFNEVGLPIARIQHGVNTDLFKPVKIEDKLRMREKEGIPFDDFVMLMVGRNQTRKMQPYMLKAFADFAKNKKDVKLLCHFDLKADIPETKDAPVLGWDLFEYGKRLGLFKDNKETKIMRTIEKEGFQYQMIREEKEMPVLYQVSDIHYNSGNEGFGVPAMEANACGVPNVSPDFTSARELTNEGLCGWLVDIANERFIIKNGAEWCFPDSISLTNTLNYIYDNREELQKKSELAVKYAQDYSWKVVIPIWDRLIQNVLNTPRTTNFVSGEIGI